MKICPTCRKTYTDESLNFCLEDGSVLTIAPTEAPPTVMMQQPAPTNPSPGIVPPPQTSPSGFGQPQQQIQTSWNPQSQYTVQPKKSSKTWLWVLGILGLVLLLCGGGFAGLIGIAIYNADNSNQSKANNSTFPSNTANTRANTAPPTDGRTKVES